MRTDKVVTNGYIKLLALSVSHLMTEIIMEKNTNCQEDIDAFREKYGNIKTIIIFIIHYQKHYHFSLYIYIHIIHYQEWVF